MAWAAGPPPLKWGDSAISHLGFEWCLRPILAADILASISSILVLAAVRLFRPDPALDWREALFTPFREQRDQFEKPGHELFMGGLGLVGVRLLLSLVSKATAGIERRRRGVRKGARTGRAD